MFTGIIEQTGEVTGIARGKRGARLTVSARGMRDLKRGESVAVNGVCLTAVAVQRAAKNRTRISFDVLAETLRVTNLRFLNEGALVNLERPLRASDRLGGHFVLGHVDGIGEIARWERRGADWLLEIAAPASVKPYLIQKGSIAVDGISLTVAKVGRQTFEVWIIPHTRAVTNLGERQPGEFVNLEADVLGKYARKFLAGYLARATS
jgi:riboflavin synthase